MTPDLPESLFRAHQVASLLDAARVPLEWKLKRAAEVIEKMRGRLRAQGQVESDLTQPIKHHGLELERVQIALDKARDVAGAPKELAPTDLIAWLANDTTLRGKRDRFANALKDILSVLHVNIGECGTEYVTLQLKDPDGDGAVLLLVGIETARTVLDLNHALASELQEAVPE